MPPRPVTRALPIAAAGLLFTAVFLATLTAARYAMAEPLPTVDYIAELNRITLGVQPEGENAWPLFVQSMRLFEIAYDAHPTGAFQLDYLLDGDWNDAENQAATQLLAELGPAFDALELASQAPAFARLYVPSDALKPVSVIHRKPVSGRNDGLPLRRLAVANAVAMRQCGENGNWDGVARHLGMGLRAGWLCTLQPEWTDWLTGSFFYVLALREVRQLALEFQPHADTCRDLLGAIRRTPARSSRSSRAFEYDRIVNLEAIQRLYSDDGIGDGVFVSGAAHAFRTNGVRTLRDRIATIASITLPRRVAVTENVLDDAARRGEWFDSSAAKRARERAPVPQFIAPALQLAGMTELTVARDVAAFYAWSQENIDTNDTERAGTLLLLRILAHDADHGRVPATLDELDAPPEETIDPVTGLPFVYKLLPASPDNPASLHFRLLSPPDFKGRITDFTSPRQPIL